MAIVGVFLVFLPIKIARSIESLLFHGDLAPSSFILALDNTSNPFPRNV